MRRLVATVGLVASVVACGNGATDDARTTTAPTPTAATTAAASTSTGEPTGSDVSGPLELVERPAGCPSPPGSATDLTAERPIHRHPDLSELERWTDRAGCEVRLDVISMVAGPAHCGWQTTTRITIGTPIGTPKPSTVGDGTRTFIWDPERVLIGIDGIDRSISLAVDELPATAADTGFRHDDTQLWLDDGDPSVAYFVAEGMADRLVIDEDHRIVCR